MRNRHAPQALYGDDGKLPAWLKPDPENGRCKVVRRFIIALNVCLCVQIGYSLWSLTMPRHERRFQPSVSTLEPRRVLDGDGLAPPDPSDVPDSVDVSNTPDPSDTPDCADVSNTPDPSGMPNGVDAFAPEAPYTAFGNGMLLMDANANLPGSPYYFSGVAAPNPDTPPPDPDPNTTFLNPINMPRDE